MTLLIVIAMVQWIKLIFFQISIIKGKNHQIRKENIRYCSSQGDLFMKEIQGALHFTTQMETT
ncbi:hypothetical protein HM131_14085 [Halobacillus mangrovi]|uniref:Uncharacterized protein n=1 Tax=Halobacillus mangrovi TaxID=402384 RepID=A0A1W5ZXD5_9BACI|nr:hypothetical protein HM131_14085 [Halobacillus mangrovi]